MKAFSAIVLAAGNSTRMGDVNKLTQPFDGKPLLLHIIDALRDTFISETVVVTGFEAPMIISTLEARRIRFVNNPRYAEGMASSIVIGINRVRNSKGALICLGDMPDVSSRVIASVLAAFRNEDSIVFPTFQGSMGHPVLFGRNHYEALSRLAGDQGAKSIIRTSTASCIEVECDDPGIHRDIDTRKDLTRAASNHTA